MPTINDPILGQIDVPETPEKVSMKDLWLENQKLKWAVKGIRVREKYHEAATACLWAMFLVLLAML